MGLDLFGLVLDIESSFGITIRDEEIENLSTVEDLLFLILGKVQVKPVPEEKLVCRRCKYSLRGLNADVCPECGEGFVRYDAAAIVRVWTRLVDVIAEASGVDRNQIKPGTRILYDLT